MKEQPLIEMSVRAPSPHEAQGLADLMMPTLREEIKELCKTLKTKPQAECATLFGDDVDFYRLKHSSAEQLVSRLRREIVLRAWQMAYDNHNAPDHDKAACVLCCEREDV